MRFTLKPAKGNCVGCNTQSLEPSHIGVVNRTILAKKINDSRVETQHGIVNGLAIVTRPSKCPALNLFF